MSSKFHSVSWSLSYAKLESGQFLVLMAGPHFGLVLVLQVLAVCEHVVEKADTWQWWVLIYTQTSNLMKYDMLR